MDTHEAKMILTERLARYRDYPYERLAGRVGSGDVEEYQGDTGTMYQLEFQFFWDRTAGAEVRVVGSIDDGGLRAFVPLCAAFIKAPDGRFVGE